MPRIVALKSFIEYPLHKRPAFKPGRTLGLLLAGGLLVSSLAWSASPPPLVQQPRPENQLLLELLNRIDRLEEEVRRLRGDLDVYHHQQESLVRRVQALEKGKAGTAGAETPPVAEQPPEPAATEVTSPPLQATPPAALTLPPGAATQPAGVQPPAAAPETAGQAPATPSAQPGANEQDTYNAAFDTLREGRYDEAITRFQEFVSSYPTSRLAGDAQYWLGESYYVVRDFDRARQAFLALGMNYPDSKRLPDAMLKLGYIYDDSGDKAKAKEVLQKLTEAYPDSRAASLARQRLQAIH
jgi:tol-pal system protein YbgF